MGMGGSSGSSNQMAEQEAQRKAEVATQVGVINDIFDSNAESGIYQQAADNVFQLDKHYLDDQRADAERMNRFALARQGLAGGSQEVDRSAALLDTYNEGILRAGQRSDKLASEWRSADEDLRNSLMRQASADPSAFNAQATQSQLSAAAEARKNSGVDQSLGSLFQDFSNQYALSRYNAGVSAGMNNGMAQGGSALPNVMSTRKRYQGS